VTHFKTALLSFIVFAGLLGSVARAQGAEDIVRWIYASQLQANSPEAKGLRYLKAPAQRGQFFSRRLVAFFEADDTYGGGLNACLGFNPDIPGNDFDEYEINRTLSLESVQNGDAKTVTARFTNFGQPTSVVYDFVVEDGFLRIDDMAGPGWRLSLIPCEPRQAQQQSNGPVSGNAYCYVNGSDTLKLTLDGSGQGGVEFESWQTNGHFCGVEGPVQPISGGWLFRDANAGPECRLEILVQPGGGLAMADRDWGCKRYFCGARAVMDGVRFPRSSQIDCSAFPANNR